MCVCECACACVCMHVCGAFTLNPVTSRVLYAFLGVIHTDEELRSALSLILPDSGYVICPGIPVDRYEDCFAVLHCHTKGVQVLQFPVKRYEAETCMRWHKPSNLRYPVGHYLHDVCANCKKVHSTFYVQLDMFIHIPFDK